MQECGLFRGIEATERELYWAGILRVGNLKCGLFVLCVNRIDFVHWHLVLLSHSSFTARFGVLTVQRFLYHISRDGESIGCDNLALQFLGVCSVG